MDEQKFPPGHVLIFPLPLRGPVNSMLKLAELLLLAGLQVTFVVTNYIYARLIRLSNIQTRLDSYPGFQVKTVSDGLPKDHPLGDQYMELFDSLNCSTKSLFKDLLVSLEDSGSGRLPVSFIIADGILGFTCDIVNDDFIIADGILGFTCDIANEVGVPIFYVQSLDH